MPNLCDCCKIYFPFLNCKINIENQTYELSFCTPRCLYIYFQNQNWNQLNLNDTLSITLNNGLDLTVQGYNIDTLLQIFKIGFALDKKTTADTNTDLFLELKKK